MERVTIILLASLTLLVMTAGAIFAVAEARSGIPALTIPLAIVSFLLVDHYRLWRLSSRAQGVLGLIAFGLAGFELFLSDIEAPLLAGGHLLTYLTCAFLLQPKGRRQVWWLAALSLLQVAVSSVLTYDAWFGLAMPVFLLLMLWTLSVFQLQQAAVAAVSATPGNTRTPAPTQLWLGRSTSTPAVQIDDQHRWVTPRFALNMVSSTALSLGLAGVFFTCIPRVWPNTNPVLFDGGRPIGGAPSRTGYTSAISLGHIGEIQESPRVAIEARLFTRDDHQPLPWGDWLALMGGSPRFRGAAQEVYEDGVWRRWDEAEGSRTPFQSFPLQLPSAVVQEIRVHHDRQQDDDVVFACGVPLRCRATAGEREIELEISSWAMLARGRSRSPAVDYTVEAVPWDPWFPNQFAQLGPGMYLNRWYADGYLRTTTRVDSELRRPLEEWLTTHAEVAQNVTTPYALARRWEEWFIRGDEFRYSLNLSIVDPTIDPLLDFLQNTRRGHCEYFASALALLLRAQGIPARVVSGYKGGQVQADGRLLVRDLHAHLWVEAFLFDAPADAANGQYGARWVTLDPTPAARDTLVQTQEQQSQSVWTQLREGWTTFWSNSIRMNAADQQALVFDPLKGVVSEALNVASGATAGGRLAELWRFLTSPTEWFSWQGGLAAFVLLVAISGAEFGRQRLWRWINRVRQAGRAAASEAIGVPFYRRLEAVLAEHGLRRPASQTPREFATATSPQLSPRIPARLHPAQDQLTAAFYALRYGGVTLSPQEEEQAERRVDELERELAADALRREGR